MKLAITLKALPLFMTTFFETAVPFVRTLILTHLLVPYEFGFASALAATSATFSQITDIAIYSFVSSSPRSVYAEVIAGAHAVSIMRGFCVGGLLLLASRPVACMFGTCDDWRSFVWLAPLMIIGSFEHFEIRVAGLRDYRYWPALIASVVSQSCGLLALTLIAYKFENHYAYIAYLMIQSLVYVLASHFLASSLYGANHTTPFVRKVLSFGFPLMLSGIGLAIMSQGDRWIVGSLMGLPFLGLYAVVTLAAYIPLSGVFRIQGAIIFAGLHNANIEAGEYDARLKLYCRAIPVIGGGYALGLLAFYDLVVPAVFGHRYVISDSAIFLLALIVYIRVIRSDPQQILLLLNQNTRKLAILGQAPFIGLLATAGLALIHPTLEFILVGGLVGEIAALCVVEYLSRPLLKSAIYDHMFSGLTMFSTVVVAGILLLSLQNGAFATRIAIVGGFLILMLAYAGLSCFGLYQRAYGEPQSSAQTPI
jgi:O-antigen/teichoic acid export membrane protein